MAEIKDIARAADKWQRRAAVAGIDYAEGVRSPRRSWSEAAAAAQQSYTQAVTQAAQQGRYAAGIKRVGEGRWVEASTRKGPNRFTEGVSLAVGEWQEGFGPYAEAIRALKLPERGPTGSPQNLQRVQAIAQALRGVREKTRR